MPVKLGVFSDTHLGRAVPRQIGEARREAYRHAFSQSIDVFIEEGADYVLHVGDLFEKRSMMPEDSVFVKQELHRLFESIRTKTGNAPRIFIIRGNHDGSEDGNTIDYVSHPLAQYITIASGQVDESAVFSDSGVCIIGISFDRYLARKLQAAAGFIRQTFDANQGKFRVLLIHGFIKGYHPVPDGVPPHTHIATDDVESLSADLVITGHYHVPLDPMQIGTTKSVTLLSAGATEAEDIGEESKYGVHIVETPTTASPMKIRFIPIDPLQLIHNVRIGCEGSVNTVEWYVSEAKKAIDGYGAEVQAKCRDGILRVVLVGLTDGDPFKIGALLERAVQDASLKHSHLIHVEVANKVDNVKRQVNPALFSSGMDFASDVLGPLGDVVPDAAKVVDEVSMVLDQKASKKTGVLTEGDRMAFVKKWVELIDRAGKQ